MDYGKGISKNTSAAPLPPELEYPRPENGFEDDALTHLGLPFAALGVDDWHFNDAIAAADKPVQHFHQK